MAIIPGPEGFIGQRTENLRNPERVRWARDPYAATNRLGDAISGAFDGVAAVNTDLKQRREGAEDARFFNFATRNYEPWLEQKFNENSAQAGNAGVDLMGLNDQAALDVRERLFAEAEANGIPVSERAKLKFEEYSSRVRKQYANKSVALQHQTVINNTRNEFALAQEESQKIVFNDFDKLSVEIELEQARIDEMHAGGLISDPATAFATGKKNLIVEAYDGMILNDPQEALSRLYNQEDEYTQALDSDKKEELMRRAQKSVDALGAKNRRGSSEVKSLVTMANSVAADPEQSWETIVSRDVINTTYGPEEGALIIDELETVAKTAKAKHEMRGMTAPQMDAHIAETIAQSNAVLNDSAGEVVQMPIDLEKSTALATEFLGENATRILPKQAKSPQYRNFLRAIEGKYKLPPGILYAIMGAESDWGANQGFSSKGALGPFQFTKATAELFGLKDPFNAIEAADAAARHLIDEMKTFSNKGIKYKTEDLIGAYNLRILSSDSSPSYIGYLTGKNSLPEETAKYIPKVMKYMREGTAALPEFVATKDNAPTVNMKLIASDARFGELGQVDNPDGGVSTEYSITVNVPELGGWVNIPSMVEGQQNVEELISGSQITPEQERIAIERAKVRVEEGATLPSYSSVEEAEAAAAARTEEEKMSPYAEDKTNSRPTPSNVHTVAVDRNGKTVFVNVAGEYEGNSINAEQAKELLETGMVEGIAEFSSARDARIASGAIGSIAKKMAAKQMKDTLQIARQKIVDAQKKDFVGYLMQNSDAFPQYTEALDAAIEIEQQLQSTTDPAEQEALSKQLGAAKKDMNNILLALQDERGIPKDMRKVESDSSVSSMVQALSKAEPTQVVMALQQFMDGRTGIAKQTLLRQMSENKQMKPEYLIAATYSDPGLQEVIVEAARVTDAEISKGMSSDQQLDIRTSISSELEDLQVAFAASGNTLKGKETLDKYKQVAYKISTMLVIQGENPITAVDRANDMLFGKYDTLVEDGALTDSGGYALHFPKDLNLDKAMIQEVGDAWTSDRVLDSPAVKIVPMGHSAAAALSPEEREYYNEEMTKTYIKEKSYWTNNNDAENPGMILMIPLPYGNAIPVQRYDATGKIVDVVEPFQKMQERELIHRSVGSKVRDYIGGEKLMKHFSEEYFRPEVGKGIDILGDLAVEAYKAARDSEAGKVFTGIPNQAYDQIMDWYNDEDNRAGNRLLEELK